MRWLERRQPHTPNPTPEAASDRALLERVALRDRAAFAELYQRYHRRLSRFLMRYTHRYDVAEEVINDTLFVVWLKAAEYRGEAQPSTWIMGIAYRRALKTLQRLAQLPGVDGRARCEEAAASPHDADAQGDWLATALAELPVEQRVALELTYVLGYSCEEVAGIMECPVNTVKTRVFHARAKLRRRLPALAGLPPGASTGDLA